MMRADPLLGQVGEGWSEEIESFLGPVKWHQADRKVAIWGPRNVAPSKTLLTGKAGHKNVKSLTVTVNSLQLQLIR